MLTGEIGRFCANILALDVSYIAVSVKSDTMPNKLNDRQNIECFLVSFRSDFIFSIVASDCGNIT